MAPVVLGPLVVAGGLVAAPAVSAAPAPPASPAGPITGSVAPEGAAAPYTAQDAARDADRMLTAEGLDYTRARSRLTRHGAQAAPALVDRMNVTPPPNPAERKRLLDVLAQLRRPEDLEVFARELERTIRQSAPATVEDATLPWREILNLQGQAAMPVYMKLVADTKLDPELRGSLLGDLVQVAPTAAFPDLVALVGTGDRRLGKPLRLALVARTRAWPADQGILLAVVDADLAAATPPRRAGLLALRAALPGGNRPAFQARLAAVATSQHEPFTARVAAIRVLARTPTATGIRALETVASIELAPKRRERQASEILGRLAADGLAPGRVAAAVDGLELTGSPAPRLAELGYRTAPTLPDGWFDDSQASVWPQVRRAALERVGPPCDGRRVKALSNVATRPARGGDPDGSVARAAAVALGRCGDAAAQTALRKLLNDENASANRRAVAARQLVRTGGAKGAEWVVRVLEDGPKRDLGRKLALALGYAPTVTARIKAGLCSALSQAPDVAAAARETLRKLRLAREGCP